MTERCYCVRNVSLSLSSQEQQRETLMNCSETRLPVLESLQAEQEDKKNMMHVKIDRKHEFKNVG